MRDNLKLGRLGRKKSLGMQFEEFREVVKSGGNGIDGSRYKLLGREDFKRLLESHQQNYIVRNIKKTQRVYEKILRRKEPDRLSLEAARDVARAAGMLPAAEQSVYIKQMNQSNTLTLSPLVQNILMDHVKRLSGGKVEEVVEAEEIRDDKGGG